MNLVIPPHPPTEAEAPLPPPVPLPPLPPPREPWHRRPWVRLVVVVAIIALAIVALAFGNAILAALLSAFGIGAVGEREWRRAEDRASERKAEAARKAEIERRAIEADERRIVAERRRREELAAKRIYAHTSTASADEIVRETMDEARRLKRHE